MASHETSQIRPINLSCITNQNSKSLNCNNPNQSPSLIHSAIPCRICGRTFTTKTGVGVHMRRAHPDEHDQHKARTDVKQRWSEKEEEEEEALLAKKEVELTGVATRFLNKALTPLFPSRSLEATEKARQKETYLTRVQEYIAMLPKK
ncbi:hypothetical protein GQX74_013959 [Glossina fuscipes]|nr:hypothetical protein GQX74_013959 [Glossina fuscipes]